MSIHSAEAGDFPAIRELLSKSQLPTQDLSAASLELFRVARENDRLIGAVGLEMHGNYALLRSLAVDPACRGRGIGAALAQSAETLAHELSVSSIFLLTTTAANFFAARGFLVVARDQVPEEIQRTKEFSSLCPATATVMVKR